MLFFCNIIEPIPPQNWLANIDLSPVIKERGNWDVVNSKIWLMFLYMWFKYARMWFSSVKRFLPSRVTCLVELNDLSQFPMCVCGMRVPNSLLCPTFLSLEPGERGRGAWHWGCAGGPPTAGVDLPIWIRPLRTSQAVCHIQHQVCVHVWWIPSASEYSGALNDRTYEFFQIWAVVWLIFFFVALIYEQQLEIHFLDGILIIN